MRFFTISDAYNPLMPANMLSEQILEGVIKVLNSNESNWAWLPGFWKQFHSPNGTVTNSAIQYNTIQNNIPDAQNILPPANDMADKILVAMAELLDKHASDWTHLPGTWKQYFAPNGTLIYYIAAGFGNFTNAGPMTR